MPPPYQNTIFLNLPVSDLSRSIVFYTALGFVQHKDCSNDAAAMMSLPPSPSTDPAKAHDGTIKLMLLSHPFFKGFMPEGIEIADATKTAQQIVCFSLESEKAVDEFLETAAKNGGRRDVRPKTEIEKTTGMYGGNACDPDGHLLEVAHMPWMFEGGAGPPAE